MSWRDNAGNYRNPSSEEYVNPERRAALDKWYEEYEENKKKEEEEARKKKAEPKGGTGEGGAA